MSMNGIKRVLWMTALIGSTFAAGVYAQDVLQKVEAYLRPDFQLVLDGKPVQLSGPPLIYEDKSYLPLAELGRLMGANILWRGETKTIYINSRINPEQRTENQNPNYESIELYNPYSTTLKYLGAEYPMLITYNNSSTNFAPYYRESDVKRMGVDTNGLNKAKERLTGALFISESELNKRLRQTPEQVYSADYESYVINGELHPEKLKMLRSHVKNTLIVNYDNIYTNKKPIIIDKVDGEEDMYDYYYLETVRAQNGYVFERYWKDRLKVTKSTDWLNTSYTVNIYSKTDLESEAIKRENP